jgi:2-C-methyl-D-erythritol 2,4-cyclodiphosphate synthase
LTLRIGLGFDSHPLVTGRDLVLAGVNIEYEKGLNGHSDGDALTHAFIDALLGAAGLGDIGTFFPSSDPDLEGVKSTNLLRESYQLVKENKFSIVNADAIIYANAPVLSPYRKQMIFSFGEVLNLDENLLNIKFKTLEGIVNTQEASTNMMIAAHFVVLLESFK